MKFIIPIEPTAQMRARHAVRGSYATTYKAPEQRQREDTLNAFLARHQPATPLPGPLFLGVRAYLAAPKTKPKWFTGSTAEYRLFVQRDVILPPVKPDLDNLVKQIKDCMTQCRYWGDDKQVVGFLPGTGKFYSDRPRWEIEIVPYDWRQNVNAVTGRLSLMENA